MQLALAQGHGALRFFVVVQIFNTVSVLADIPLLQEAIKLKTRQAEELAGLVVGECAGTVPFDDQSLKSFTPWILMMSEIVRKLYRYLHTGIIRLTYEMPNRRKLTTDKSPNRGFVRGSDSRLSGRAHPLRLGDCNVGTEVDVLNGVE